MSLFLFKEMGRAKTQILQLGAMVEDSLHKAVESINGRDADLAEEVLKLDEAIDSKEVDIEEDLLKILALHQPVAVDLRFLVALLKINNDLERIGDLAVNLAKRGRLLARHAHVAVPVDFSEMSASVESMLKKSIDSLVNLDADQAHAVCQEDDRIDDMKRSVDKSIRAAMVVAVDADHVDVLLAEYRIARDLERIADHATNIAEDMIYMTDGNIVRHHTPA